MSMTAPQTTDATALLRDRAGTAVDRLQDRLRLTRRHLLGQRAGIVICAIVSMVMVCLAVGAFADWILELDAVWRTLWIVGIMVGAAIASIRGKRWVSHYNLSDAAVDAERNLTQFGQRLRTTVDYEVQSPPPAKASPALLCSLREETGRLAEQTEWSDAVDHRPLLMMLSAVAVLSLSGIVTLVVLPEFRIAAARSILVPLEYTTVTFSPVSAIIRPGESVTVEANVSGRPIKTAELRFRPAGSDEGWTTIDLVMAGSQDGDQNNSRQEPVALIGQLTTTLSNLTSDTEFAVVAGPRRLPSGSIRVLQPLILKKIEAEIIPPPYTRRSPETAESLDLKILEGSSVQFSLEFNRPAAEAKLVRTARYPDADPQNPVAAEIPLERQDHFLRGQFHELRRTGEYALTAVTADGMSLDPLSFTVHVQPDQPPLVKFIDPPEELVVTPTTEVPMIIEASDDIGLRKVGVMYQIASGPMQTLIEETAQESMNSFRGSAVLLLENHALTFHEAVTYYAFAEDDYFGQPRRTTTPLRFIDIRPYKLDFQVVNSNCKCSPSVTLEELISRQRQGLSQAFHAAQQQPPSREIASRLSESQVEVQAATTEFANGLADRGVVIPALGQAVEEMDDAIDALVIPDFEATVHAEQKALAALISARENLRKKLNQADSQCASACKKFDREQRQKLRMPEKKKSDKQQQVAQMRQQIEELAKRERQWSEDAKQCCNSLSQSSSKSKETKSTSSQSPQAKSSESTKPPESSQVDEQKNDAPTEAEVAANQKQLQSELAKIQEQLEKLEPAGKAARELGKQAAESMQQGLAEFEKRDADAASKEGERSAQQLEQLSDHLASMNSHDFGQRLEQAWKLAQQLADREEALEKRFGARAESKPESSELKPGDKSSESTKSASHDKSGTKESGGGKSNNEIASSGPDGEETSSEASGTNGKKLEMGDFARDQQGISVQTDLLSELLDRLTNDAVKEPGAVRQSLEQVNSKNSPRQIAEGMRHTIEDLNAGRKVAAQKGVDAAKVSLQELSKSLGAARGEYAQPQLKELMAIEEQLAQLQEQMRRARTQGDASRAMAEQKWQQLESRLEKIATADRQLADALQKLREGPPSKASSPNDGAEKSRQGTPSQETSKSENGATQVTPQAGKAPPTPGSKLRPNQVQEFNGQQTPEGFYSWLELGDFSAVREVSKAIQTRIQEVILAGALIDADQPVPPAYKELVEKYFRALSDDLR